MDFKHNTALLLLICLAGVVATTKLETVVGGVGVLPLQLHLYPYVVSIRNKTHGHFCSGSLITPDRVLSAAHCFIRKGIFKCKECSVIAGEINTKVYNSPINITYIYTHLNYFKPEKGIQINDIAVAKLKSSFPVAFGTSINLINLPVPGEQFGGQNATFVGFGYDQVTENNSTLSDEPEYIYSRDPIVHLHRIDVQILKADQCHHDDLRICVKSFKPGVGTCRGDSGGPLVIGNKVVGMSSQGKFSCDSSFNHGSHMTNISTFVTWIEDAKSTKNTTKQLLLHIL